MKRAGLAKPLYVAFAVIVAAGLWLSSRRPAIRGLALAYPLLVTLLVMATANHLWIDAIAGALAALGGLAGARAWREAMRASRWVGGAEAHAAL